MSRYPTIRVLACKPLESLNFKIFAKNRVFLWTGVGHILMFSLPGGDVDRFAAMGSLTGPLASGSSGMMTLEAWRKLVFLRFEGLLSEWGQASGRFCGPFGLAGI